MTYDATTLARFWAKVNKHTGKFHDGVECWEWTASTGTEGYGQFRAGGTMVLAHRFIYQFRHGPIARELRVCHHCDNRICLRDEHHFLGTDKDNMQDALRKGRLHGGFAGGYPTRGEANVRAMLTEENVRYIHAHYTGKRGEQKALADRFGVTIGAIWHIVHGRNWRHIPAPEGGTDASRD